MKMPEEHTTSLTLETTTLPTPESVRAGLLKLKANPEQIETVLWFLEYGQEARGAKSRGDLANLISVNGSTVSKVFTGSYPGSLEGFCSKVRAFRGGAGVSLGEWPMADTRIAREIGLFCDATRRARQMSMLWGPNQSGKSFALKMYAAKPRDAQEGRTFYVFTPAGGGTRSFLIALARALCMSNTVTYQSITDSLHGYLKPGDLLIVDEYHQVLIGKQLRTVTIEKIKEIFEMCGCAILLCGTDVLPERMSDPRLKPFLGQTANRGALRRRIPPEPYKSDIVAAFAAYGFPPLEAGKARDVAEQMGRLHGLGQIFRQLQLATILAANRKERLSLDHFLKTVKTMTDWSEGKKPEDEWPAVAAQQAEGGAL